jgi:hypothetical protein
LTPVVVVHHGGAGGTGGRRGGTVAAPGEEPDLVTLLELREAHRALDAIVLLLLAAAATVLRLYTVTGSDRSTFGSTPPPLPPSLVLSERCRCGRPRRPRPLEKSEERERGERERKRKRERERGSDDIALFQMGSTLTQSPCRPKLGSKSPKNLG